MKIDYDKVAHQYERNRQVNGAVLTELIETSRINDSSCVLDVGCGTGNYICAIAERVHCRCWGLEPSDSMRAVAQRKASETVTLVKGFAEEMVFADDFFDLIFSVDVIHHVSNRKAHFERAHSQLVRGGRLCIVTDSEEVIRRREPLSRYFPETVEVELRRYPRVALLQEELNRSGFAQVTERTTELPYQVTSIQPYADKAFSSLHLISEETFARGLARLKEDLAKGSIKGVARYVHIWATK